MKTRQRAALVLFLAMMTICQAGLAMAADGTLKVSFKYKDPVTGLDQNLIYGYIYLHNAAKPAPMEKFFAKADYILGGPASDINGNIAVTVPEGQYFIRVLQRKMIGSVTRPYGPPETGDLTWFQTAPITITANTTLDLGTKYATPFASSPITITGTVKTSGGIPLQGRYVRAQTESCVAPVNCTDSGCEQYGNQCGPTKFLALQTTDADGRYTLLLADPGTYYVYTSPCLSAGHNQNDPTRCPYTGAPTPVTAIKGDAVTVDIVVN